MMPVLVLACSAEQPDESSVATDESPLTANIAKMRRNDDGSYEVTCRDGHAEHNVSVAAIKADQVCNPPKANKCSNYLSCNSCLASGEPCEWCDGACRKITLDACKNEGAVTFEQCSAIHGGTGGSTGGGTVSSGSSSSGSGGNKGCGTYACKVDRYRPYGDTSWTHDIFTAQTPACSRGDAASQIRAANDLYPPPPPGVGHPFQVYDCRLRAQ